jgi:hypothetical protein
LPDSNERSIYELIKTEKIEKEFIKSILSKIQVFSSIESWVDYLKQKQGSLDF